MQLRQPTIDTRNIIMRYLQMFHDAESLPDMLLPGVSSLNNHKPKFSESKSTAAAYLGIHGSQALRKDSGGRPVSTIVQLNSLYSEFEF